MMRTKDVVLMATVTSFEAMSHPGKHELKQFAELFEPVYKASSPEARRNAVAALSRLQVVPQPVSWFIASQPIEIAAIFLTRSPAIDDDMLIAVARTHGPAHAKAIAARAQLSVKVVDALVAVKQGAEGKSWTQPQAEPEPAETLVTDRDEALRERLKDLVKRETMADENESPERLDAQRAALLVRFARLREARNFSATLSDTLGASRWLSDRILLDLSGAQLATALVAIGLGRKDGEFILGEFYPHLKDLSGNLTRAAFLWSGLDEQAAIARVDSWIRADDYTQGKSAAQNPANSDEETSYRPAVASERMVFGRARRGGRLR